MFFLFMKVVLVLANSADRDEMQYNAAFHLGLHRFPKYLIGVSSMQGVQGGFLHIFDNGILISLFSLLSYFAFVSSIPIQYKLAYFFIYLLCSGDCKRGISSLFCFYLQMHILQIIMQ